MSADERAFLRRALLTALAVIMAALLLVWVFDTMFNGSLLDFFAISLGSMFYRPTRYALLGVGVIAMLVVTMACVAVAYRTFIGQHVLYLAAKREAEQAKAAARMESDRRGDMITYLAHDLRTPLSSVIAYLTLMEESPELPPDQRAKFIGVSLEKAYRLETLIEELFDTIRSNIQSIQLNESSIPLKFMLEQMADEFYPILLSHGKSVKVICGKDQTLRGDADKLARVFNNILKNAAAYSYDNTIITIEARPCDDNNTIDIIFTNQGDIIPSHKRELIFNKFYRLDAARGGAGGAGLGLAIAREIALTHGGDITVTSGEGGTAFVVSLPARGRKV